MSYFAYHASHEQFPPRELLRLAVLAEQAGFQGVSSSDHFYPWSERQGESGYSFAWLGAAMQATRLPFSLVCAPGQRYHPAIVAQAIATLAELFPGRLRVDLGSGEALNELITGEPWPDKPARNRRLRECSDIIRRLLGGETVEHEGEVRVHCARLYTRPPEPPQFTGCALSEETARWLGGWADGLTTVHQPLPQLKAVLEAFRAGGGVGKPVYLKVQLSYARSRQEALDGAMDQWRCNVLPPERLCDLSLPEEFDAAARDVREEELEKMVHVSADLDEHLDWLRAYRALGFAGISLHNVNRGQERFIEDFGRRVLPALRADPAAREGAA